MAKKQIVWSQYLSERTLLRAWYTLENNYFKSAIKRTVVGNTKSGQASFAKCHNALYTGLYFGDGFDYLTFKPVPEIKKNKGLTKGGVIANTMPPYEILKNIHAMNKAGNEILTNGNLIKVYNGFDNTSGNIYEICFNAGKDVAKIQIDNNLVNKDKDALNPIQKPCYSQVKKIKEHLKLGKPVGTVYGPSKQFKKEKFDESVKKYKQAYEKFVLSLANYGIFGQEKINLMLQSLDNGLYQTMIGNLGFNFNDLMQKENLQDLVSRKEIELHTNKLNLACSLKTLNYFDKSNLETFSKYMKFIGGRLRENYISKNKVYPECNKGFYNEFANMLSQNFEKNKLDGKEAVKNYPELFNKIIKEMQVLKQIFVTSNNIEYKKEVQKKLDDIEKTLVD